MTEYWVSLSVLPGESAREVFERAAELLRQHRAVPVAQQVFGLADVGGAGLAALRAAFGGLDWPVTWVDEGCRNEPRLAGTLLYAIAGAALQRVRFEDRVVGTVYEDAYARYCMLGDLRDADTSHSPPTQARQVWDNLVKALNLGGFDLTHLLRTWFWNDDILGWYGQFNQVRTSFFSANGVFDRMVPASTGIGGHNSAGAALVAAAFAVIPKDDRVVARAVPSPLQCPALQYGSSFNRAVELAAPAYRWLTISGSASIDPHGVTAHVGDVDKQIDLTMRVVGAILESVGMNWSDVVRGLAYILRAADADAYLRYCRRCGLPAMPVVLTNNVVCRNDLLFELEADAVRTGKE